MRRTLILPGSSVHSGSPCDQRRAKSSPSALRVGRLQARDDRRQQPGRVVEQRQRLDVGVEVRRDRRAQRQRVRVEVREAPQIVERHRRQRRGQLAQLLRRRVQAAALVGRADDEHAHVARARRGDRGQVVLEQVVGVQVDVVEPVRLDDVDQEARRRVRREADVPDAPGAAKLVRHLEAAAGAQRQRRRSRASSARAATAGRSCRRPATRRIPRAAPRTSAAASWGRSFVCSTNALRGWRASALPSCCSLVP